jgi:hypothetical protein
MATTVAEVMAKLFAGFPSALADLSAAEPN